MKRTINFFFAILSVSLFIACAEGETQTLKQARQEQDALMRDAHALDSTVTAYTDTLSAGISLLAQDSTLSTDTTVMNRYKALNARYNDITTLKSEVQDWNNNMKLMPSVSEMADGAENPYGEEAKDEDVLNGVRKSRADFEILKTRVQEAMK